MHLYACGAASRLHTAKGEDDIQTLACECERICSCPLVTRTSCNSDGLGKSLGREHTLRAGLVSSSTSPCCKRLEVRCTGLECTLTGQLRPAHRALSKGAAKRFHIALSICRSGRFHWARGEQGVFHLDIETSKINWSTILKSLNWDLPSETLSSLL